MGLNKGIGLIFYELKFLIRQKFLLVFFCAAIVLSGVLVYQAPSSVDPEIFYSLSSYPEGEQKDFFLELAETHPKYDLGLTQQELSAKISVPDLEKNMTMRDALTIAHKLQDIENTRQQRHAVYTEIKVEKEALSSNNGTNFDLQKMSVLEKAYEEEPEFRLYDFSGWQIYFLTISSMQPNNFCSVIHILIIVSAGLLVFLKDREYHTGAYLFPARYGRNGMLYAAKLASIFVYGVALQIILNGLYIAYLNWYGHFDMSHWLSDICNIPSYALSEINMSILSLILLDILLKAFLSIGIILFVLLFVRVLKQYILLLIGAIGLSVGMYWRLYQLSSSDSTGTQWLANPMSILHFQNFLRSDIIEVAGAASQTRLIFATIWGTIFIFMLILFYKVWKWGTYE